MTTGKKSTDDEVRRKSAELDQALATITKHVPSAANLVSIIGVLSVIDDADAVKEVSAFAKRFWKSHGLPDWRAVKIPTDVAWAMLDTLEGYLATDRFDSREPDKTLPKPTRDHVAGFLAFEIRAAFPEWTCSRDAEFSNKIYSRMSIDGTRAVDRTGSQRDDPFNEDPKKTIIAAFKAAGLIAERADKLFHAEVVKLSSGKGE